VNRRNFLRGHWDEAQSVTIGLDRMHETPKTIPLLRSKKEYGPSKLNQSGPYSFYLKVGLTSRLHVTLSIIRVLCEIVDELEELFALPVE
jgi:hypothetical protein